MSYSIIALLRVVHIAFGAFWVGGTISAGFFLLPALKADGALGGQFAAQLLARTRLIAAITAAGAIAIISGGALYRSLWAGSGFDGPARWYALGGHFAILAFLLTGAVVLPAAHKLRRLAGPTVALGSPLIAGQNAQVPRLMNRVTRVTQVSGILLILTVALMAIGRYV